MFEVNPFEKRKNYVGTYSPLVFKLQYVHFYVAERSF